MPKRHEWYPRNHMQREVSNSTVHKDESKSSFYMGVRRSILNTINYQRPTFFSSWIFPVLSTITFTENDPSLISVISTDCRSAVIAITLLLEISVCPKVQVFLTQFSWIWYKYCTIEDKVSDIADTGAQDFTCYN